MRENRHSGLYVHRQQVTEMRAMIALMVSYHNSEMIVAENEYTPISHKSIDHHI